MPSRVVESSALVASISMHQKAFEQRRKAYEAKRVSADKQAREEQLHQIAEQDAKTEARCFELRRERVSVAVGKLGLDPEVLSTEQLLHKELNLERQRAKKAAKKAARKLRKQEEEEAAAIALQMVTAAARLVQRWWRAHRLEWAKANILEAMAVDR